MKAASCQALSTGGLLQRPNHETLRSSSPQAGLSPPTAGLTVGINTLFCPQSAVRLQCSSTRSVQSCDREKTKLCVSLVCLSGFYAAYKLQSKPLPSALRRSGSLTASQTALTAPFNLTNNSLLTGAVFFSDCISELILTQQ